MRSDLFEKANLEAPSTDRFTLQNSQMLKVSLGPDVLASKGSMVAYQGQMEFHHEKAASLGQLAKKVFSSENVALMRVRGQGQVFFADEAGYINLLHLENEGISVNSRNLLAFDASMQWDINRTKSGGMVAGGFFNTTVGGTGTVAVVVVGKPVVLDCSQQPVFVDPQSAVCWSTNLTPGIHSSMQMSSLLRGGSGEAFQLVFHGPGFVVVQAYEWKPVRTA
jgi:uncharacterized protein (AIM24 family)